MFQSDASFTDEEVVAKDFPDKVKDIVEVIIPFIHLCVRPSPVPARG